MIQEPFASIQAERERQNEKWGKQRHEWCEWIAILTEEVGEASQQAVEERFRPADDLTRLREELVHVAAVAVQIIELIDEVESVKGNLKKLLSTPAPWEESERAS